MEIVTTPISAAGGPPRRTIARTIGRKLPESFTFEVVVIAVRSLKMEKASRIAEQGEIPVGGAGRQDRQDDDRRQASALAEDD